MKIVDVAEFWSERGGGVRTYLTHFLREGSAQGHEVCVLAPGPRDEVTELCGGRLIRVAGPPLPYDPTYHALWRIHYTRKLIRQERPDVIQASSPWVAGWIAASLREIPVRSLVAHADFLGAYARPVLTRAPAPAMALALQALRPGWAYLRALSKRVDATIASGPWMADPLRANGCPRVLSVPFGVDRAGLGPDRHDAALRRSLLGPFGVDPRAALLVSAGRLAIEKRVALVIDAVRMASTRRPLALVVLGDGPEKERLQRRARGLPVHFLGFRKGAGRELFARVLASADALVHGSACETFGFTLVEALASGTPVVVPDEGAAAFQGDDTCRETYRAWQGPSGCAAAILRLLDRPRASARAAAAQWAERVPTLSSHFTNLFEVYARMREERACTSS